MAVYLIISLFAFYGFYCLLYNIMLKMKVNDKECGGKLCLVPKPGDEALEGKIRSIFMDEISEKLGTDGRLYIQLEENDPNKTLVEKLICEYPRLVLMDNMNWSRIKDRV